MHSEPEAYEPPCESLDSILRGQKNNLRLGLRQ